MYQTQSDKLRQIVNHPNAEKTLWMVSATESVFFPIPPDIMLIPMTLAKPMRAFRYALGTTLASTIGALIGYLIGALFFQTIGSALLNVYGGENAFQIFKDYYISFGIWILMAGALTPIPFKVITISSGVVGLNPILFVIVSFGARGLRFFAIAFVVRYIGNAAQRWIEKYFAVLMIAFCIITATGFLILTLL